MTPMLDTDDVGLWYALYRFMASYWFEVDSNGGGSAHEFYFPGALFAVGDNRFEGREKIRAFYAKRRQRGPITSRHLINNLRVMPVNERQVRLIGVLTLYYAHGHAPHNGTHPPMLVADISADCELDSDGSWRFRSHVLSPLFVGNAVPPSISVEAERL
jgi:hypothetical protein